MWANRHNSASSSDTDSIPDNPASDGYDDYQLEEYNEAEESVKGDGMLTAEQERDKLQILLSESTQEIKRLRELAAENNRLTIGVVGGIGRCKHWTNLLANWVREELFPKVKFVTGDYDLEMRAPTALLVLFVIISHHSEMVLTKSLNHFGSHISVTSTKLCLKKGMPFQHQSERVSKVSSK